MDGPDRRETVEALVRFLDCRGPTGAAPEGTEKETS